MLNICGCLVHALPDMVGPVIAAIAAAEGAEVHAHDNGRIVVTVEDTPARSAAQQIMDLHQIAGVLTVTLSYHHFEALDDNAETLAAPI